MICERIYLLPDNDDAYIDTYVPDKLAGYTRKALLVIPGGGYGGVSFDREGEPIAQAFIPYGFACFVLHYSVARKRCFPSQLIEASAAVKHIRDNAEKYGIDPQKLFAVGFSAGGHLTGSLGTLWHLDEVNNALDMPLGYNKPNGVMLIYPVITADIRSAHNGSFQNLFGKEFPSDEERCSASLEKHVDKNSSPAFIVHTANDDLVPVKNSLLMADAYTEAKIPFELHIYPNSPHGMALGNKITANGVSDWQRPGLDKWIEAAAVWVDNFM